MDSIVSERHVAGGGQLRLRLLEGGNPSGPTILFLHGFSQSAWIWDRQFAGELAQRHRLAALDLRGHGGSEKPMDAAAYADPQLWADDVAAAVAALGDRPVILVAWSYGGLVACDYLRKYGASRLAGLALVSALTRLGDEQALSLLGPNVLPMVPSLFATDLATVVPALCSFIRECHATPLDDRDLHQMLGFNCIVPSEVRAALFSRQLINDDVLAAVRIPTLVVHGAADTVVVPAAAARLKAQIPTARVTLIDRAGHCVFREAPGQFDQELLDFVRTTQA